MNRGCHLHTAQGIPRHVIGRSYINFFLFPFSEYIDSGMFQEASNNTDYTDIFRGPLHAGNKAADTAHDQIYLYACL